MFKVSEADAKKLAEVAAEAKKIAGVTVRLVRAWLWVDGDTKPVKEALKELGFHYAPKKCKWYFTLEKGKCHYKKNIPWNEITGKYGEEVL